MKKILLIVLLALVTLPMISAQPYLERIEIRDYERRWNDAGSGHKNDMALWHPKVPAGYFAFGSIGVNSNGYDPNGKVVTYAFKPVQKMKFKAPDGMKSPDDFVGKDRFRDEYKLALAYAEGFTLIVYPVDYKQVWKDEGSGAEQDGSVWEPICPEGYLRLGMVANAGYGKPSTKDCGCLFDDVSLLEDIVNPTANYVWFSSGVASVKSSRTILEQLILNNPDLGVLWTVSTNFGESMVNAMRVGRDIDRITSITATNIEPSLFSNSGKSVISVLAKGSTISTGQKLVSANSQFYVIAQDDGNLVIYDQANKPIWATNTNGKGPCKLQLQQDGNLCLNKNDGTFIWCSMKTNAAKVVMENDGRLVQYDNANKPIWASR